MYQYLSSSGLAGHPTRADVVRLATDAGTITALVLDANVCLDLVELARLHASPRRTLQTQKFVRQIAKSGVDVLPGFGLAELSLRRADWTLDKKKLEAFETAISSAIDSAPGRRQGLDSAESTPPAGAVDADLLDPLVPLLQVFYASLLKIACLATGDLSRSNALRNVRRYLSWATAEFDCVAALPLQAAVAIFGGDSLARKLIGVGAHGSARSAVWGGAWDVFHLHHLYDLTFAELEGTPIYPIFVTRDRAFYRIFSGSRLRAGLRFAPWDQLNCVGISSDFPHYSDVQDELDELFRATVSSRTTSLFDRERMTHKHLQETIEDLEAELEDRVGGKER